MAKMVFLGIDPGASGGVACLTADRDVVLAVAMPETDADLLAVLAGAVDRVKSPSLCHGTLEKVHSSPQMGVTSAFTFGMQYGRVRMALAALHIPFDEVAPPRWQRRLECLSGGDKSVTKVRAQQLFPGVKVTHYIADALLLAEFCRRTHCSDPLSSTSKGAGSGREREIQMDTGFSRTEDDPTEFIE